MSTSGGTTPRGLTRPARSRRSSCRSRCPSRLRPRGRYRPPTSHRVSRRRRWSLALAVGIAIGFIAGYGVGTRRPPAPAAAPVAVATPAPPAAQEFTESPVVSPAPPAADATPPPAAAATPPPAAAAPPPAAAAAAPPLTPPTAAASPKPEAVTPAPAAEGRLLVRSTPAGARVFVDGTEYGPTPVAVRALSPGGHRVRVVRDGLRRRGAASRDHAVAAVAVGDDRARTGRRRGRARRGQGQATGVGGWLERPLHRRLDCCLAAGRRHGVSGRQARGHDAAVAAVGDGRLPRDPPRARRLPALDVGHPRRRRRAESDHGFARTDRGPSSLVLGSGSARMDSCRALPHEPGTKGRDGPGSKA